MKAGMEAVMSKTAEKLKLSDHNESKLRELEVTLSKAQSSMKNMTS